MFELFPEFVVAYFFQYISFVLDCIVVIHASHSQGDNPSDHELRELWASLSHCLPTRVNSDNKPVSDNYSQIDFDQVCRWKMEWRSG
jgi:hypothetical protein